MAFKNAYKKRGIKMNRYLIGFDIGTLSSKAVLTDLKGNIIARAQYEHSIDVDKPGYQEKDMNIWWDEFKKAVSYFLKITGIKADEIKAIGATGLVPALCCIDKDGNAVRKAILHTDVRAEKELQYINKKLKSSITHGCMLPKLMWVKENEPENYKKIYKVMVPHGYIAYKLCSATSFDYDTATIIGEIFDSNELKWKDDVMAELGINPSILPDCCPAAKVLGTISRSAAEETGLSTSTKVIAGTGDTFSSMIGGGAYQPKNLMIYLGTSATILYSEGNPKDYISVPHFGDKKGHFMGKILSFGESMMHLRNTLRYDNWEDLNSKIENIPAGSEGLFYLPHYKQQNDASYFGQDAEYVLGFRGCHTQFHLYKAMIEGIAFNIRSNLSSFNVEIDKINIFGGGANSKEICQTIADVTNKEMRLCPKSSTAFGIAFLAGYCSGEIAEFEDLINYWFSDSKIIKPQPEENKKYNEIYNKYVFIREKIKSIDTI